MIYKQQNQQTTNFERYPKVLYERKKRPSFWFGLTLFIIGFVLTITSLNIYKPTIVPSKLRVLSLNKKVNILVLGCDEIYGENGISNGSSLWKGRSDTIVLVNCNPFKNTLNILNIPRDTKVKISGHGVEKINYINSLSGPIVTKKCLERLLKIRIDHYVVVNIQGLSKIINETSGIYINVPQRMEYHDKAGMLHINLFPGLQKLNGEQAVGFLRFRHDSLGDIGRIQRQQEFMRAVFTKLLDPITFTKLPEIFSIYKKTILTDLRPQEIIKIANFARNIPSTNQNIAILPGEFGGNYSASYWIPDQKEIDKLVKKLFYDERNLLKFKKAKREDVKVSIFNGSKNDRYLATKLSKLLREYGYTVLLAQDYGSNVTKTKIYAQKANSEIAQQIKYDIGNFGELLIGNLGPPDADVTILAGEDLTKVKLRKRH